MSSSRTVAGWLTSAKTQRDKALVALDEYTVIVEGTVLGKAVADESDDALPADHTIDDTRVFHGEISAKTLEDALL